jgi:menaquinone-dependent protoporphyrinogen IX oxidase
MEISRTNATELEEWDFTVDICPINLVVNLERYSHVVIGSAERVSAPLPKITIIIEGHRSELRGIPLVLFAGRFQNNGVFEAGRKARLVYLDMIRRRLRLKHEAFYSGVYDPVKVS